MTHAAFGASIAGTSLGFVGDKSMTTSRARHYGKVLRRIALVVVDRGRDGDAQPRRAS
jgi:hypothetical protein